MNWIPPYISSYFPDWLIGKQSNDNPSKHLKDVQLNENLIKFLNKEGLDCDPFYSIIVLALPHLMAQNYSSKKKEEYLKNKAWIKLRLSPETSTIQIDGPSYKQGIGRTLTGHSREELCLLRKHIVKAAKWTFQHKDEKAIEAIKTIFSYTILGLKELEDSYGPEVCDKEALNLKLGEDKLIGQVEEKNSTSRCLEQDSSFIQSILAESDNEKLLTFITGEEVKLFELRDLAFKSAIKVQKGSNQPENEAKQEVKANEQKIDEFFAEQIKNLWPTETLIAIANLFNRTYANLIVGCFNCWIR